ncbi:hypothetical protein [uncultured Microbacterium sp.]|uniref:hypothetical protein n=1 Tax=uncultured Microbacterium sp. TaxID=191216 RepID=UPI00261E8255|nr:hypothetical protein [uncultured Microbacterium sp.]
MSDHPEHVDDEPTDADETPYPSLDAAFSHQQTPLENRAFIRNLLAEIDVAGYYDRGNYIKVTRAQGGYAIQLHYGYSNGFRGEAEITRGVGDVDRWRSGRGINLWGVSHPENKLRSAGTMENKSEKREWGFCPICGLKLPASARCDNCD